MSAPRYTLAEIVEATGKSRSGLFARAAKESWPFAEIHVKGGKQRLYPLPTLPKDIRDAIARHSLKLPVAAAAPLAHSLPLPRGEGGGLVAPKPSVPAVRAPISAEAADARQLVRQQARLCILAAIRKAVATKHHATEAKACESWLEALAAGELTPQQMLWSALANDKNGFRFEVSFATGVPVAIAHDDQEIDDFARELSKGTLQRWLRQWRQGGDDALIPGKRLPDMAVPAWAPYFLAIRQRPQKPSVKTSYEMMVRELRAEGWTEHASARPLTAREYPDYSTVNRWYVEKFSKLDAQKGRNTGSALNPYRFCHIRSAEGMTPLQEVHSDGWSTKFYAPHPVSGKWVTGEVWHSHDVATRKAYVHERSIGLSESTTVIMGALYAVCAEDGEPLFWQTDNTGAVKNDRIEFDPVASMAARRSIEIVHNIPGNSQANGIAESFNRYLQERAKELATYKGDGQDSRTQIRIHKITNKLTKVANTADAAEFSRLRAEAEKVGAGTVFACWSDAVAWVKRVVAEFNDRPHRSLEKTIDRETGKRRHMTPNEKMAEFIADGWKRAPLAGEDLVDAFRVHEIKRVTRGCVQIMGQRYHHGDLDHHNGEDVLVAYDIEDGSRVFIKSLAGVPMYTAAFYESRGYRMQSFVEIAANKRADQQINRLDIKKAAIEAQRPGVVIDMPDLRSVIESTAVRVEHSPSEQTAQVLETPVDTEIARNRRINQMEDPALVRHLAAHPADINAPRARYLLEQADRIVPLARLIGEVGLWNALESAAAEPGFEKRAAVSGN